jgi:hypothetical protein
MNKIYLALAENLQSMVDAQSRIALKINIEWKVDRKLYNKDDVMNVSLVFMHIIWNIAADHCMNERWMSVEQAGLIAEEIWKNIRQTILLGTWIDTHK